MKYAVSHMSLAHTFGNVTAFVTEYIKSIFPANYFRTVNISSTMAHRYFNIFDNTNREFIRKRKPILIIRPRIDFGETDLFMNNTLLTTRITDNYIDRDFTNLQDFFSDDDLGIYIKFLLNRIKMSFDISIVVEQQMEQINQFYYIKNAVRQERPFFMPVALESNIPKNIMKVLSDEVQIPMTNIPELLEYLNSNTKYPITYKLKNSTGNDEFFRYYPTQLDTMFTNLSMDDGNKKGFIHDTYTINFTLTTEFFTSGLYYYFTKNNRSLDEIRLSIDADNSIIPIFTIDNLFSDIDKPPGWNMYTNPMFKVSTDKGPDTLDLKDIFNNSIKASIIYHNRQGMTLSPLIKVFVMKDNVKLSEESGDYSIDFNSFLLKINNTNKTSTYRLIVYVNTLYVNNLLTEIYNFKAEK